MADSWTNADAIERWGTMPWDSLAAMDPDGDFAKRHLINPTLLRMLGDVRGRRILDAGCGHGYFSRILADRRATVTGVEPGRSLYEYSVEKERENPRGIRYLQADLAGLDLDDLDGPFDAVVASMVLPAIPDWRPAVRACVRALKGSGTLVVTTNHPCFEQLWTRWREHGEYRLDRYLEEYEIEGASGVDFHRAVSTYLNTIIGSGCRIREIAEPGLDAETAEGAADGSEAYVHLPNFLVIAAERL